LSFGLKRGPAATLAEPRNGTAGVTTIDSREKHRSKAGNLPAKPMRKLIKRLVNGALEPLGLEVCRIGGDPFWVQAALTKETRPTIFDVGAAGGELVGIYRKMFPQGTIHAFEPYPDSFRVLKNRFGADGAAKLNDVAISDVEEHVTLQANRLAATNSLLETDPRGAGIWGDRLLESHSTVRVRTTTIDAYCQANRIESVDILKIDIQGSELKALRGAQSMLERGRVKLIYMEIIIAPAYIGQPNLEDYLGYLRGLGYTLINMYNLYRNGVLMTQMDVIFTRDSVSPDERLSRA
jgi:FkbM family methyltransferase